MVLADTDVISEGENFRLNIKKDYRKTVGFR